MNTLPSEIICSFEQYIPDEIVKSLSLLNKDTWNCIKYTHQWYSSMYKHCFKIQRYWPLTESKIYFNDHRTQICYFKEHDWVGIYWGILYCIDCGAKLQQNKQLIHPIYKEQVFLDI